MNERIKLSITTRYPNSPDYEYETRVTRLNLDDERVKDVLGGHGFVVTSAKPIKDDIKDPDGIFSSKFGMTLQDVQATATRYKCKCGHTISRLMLGEICPICNTEVKFIDDDFSYFGWLVLKNPYYIIHPALFMSLSSFISSDTFLNIIKIQSKKDEDGNDMEIKIPKNEPFYGIGMMEFYKRFDEVMEYYCKKHKTPNKQELYTDIMENKDKVFTQSIPVYTTLLRPYKLEGEELHFEGTNALYKMCTTLTERINKDNLRMNSKSKSKNELLFNLQMKVKELYDEINKILSGKKGTIRQLYGGRFNFTNRSVIVPDPTLRLDQVRLSYPALCGLLQQRIINVLQKSHNMSYAQAYIYLERHAEDNDSLIMMILEGFIKNDCNGRGIPLIINRNPTIAYGGILQCYCIGIGYGYTMSMPLTVLKGLAADFDGDTLNVMLIINEDFRKAAEVVLNPANAMIISKNDGMFNSDYNHQRDTIINMNTLLRLSRDNYTHDRLERIKAMQASF